MTLINPDCRSTNRKWFVKCDWPTGCAETWWSGRANPPHYCPARHAYENKKLRNRESCKRWHIEGPIAGTAKDRRRGHINKAHSSIYQPVCGVCGESFDTCRCIKIDEVKRNVALKVHRYEPPQVATWRPECEPLPLWCKEQDK